MQDLRDYWQARGRWEERQVIDEDWAIYRYLQQRRREQNYRLKRHLKVERKRHRDKDRRRNQDQPPAATRASMAPRAQNDAQSPQPTKDPFENDLPSPTGYQPQASRYNAVYPG